jgi:hypothetical protein
MNKKIALSCLLYETPHDEEYWKISVEKQEKPESIIFEMDDENMKIGPEKTEFLVESVVKGISIFSKELQTDFEHLFYDHVVVFQLENGKILCISAMSGPCGVDIMMDEKDIQDVLERCYEKRVLF